MKPRLPLQSKTFWAYLTSFLSIVLLPLIVIWILLSTVLNRSVQAQFLTYESQILRSVSEQVDANVSYSIYASYYLGGNRAFRRLMMETELPRNTREDSVREVSGYLRDVIGTASINALSCIYLPHRDLVVTASGGMYSFEGFYDQILNFSDCSAEELLSQLRAVNAPAFLRPVTQALSGQQWLCMAVHISAGYLNRPAYLLAFYQVDKLTNVLTQRLPDQSLFSICSPEGEYLTGTAPLLPLPEGEEILSHQIDGTAYLAFLETSSASGLRFIYYLPQAHVLRQLTVYQRVFVAVLCALLALCGAMAFLLAYRHYLPIRRLFQRAFPSAIPSGRELERVSESLEQARKQGEVYSRQVRSQYAQLQNQLLGQLLTVAGHDDDALSDLLGKYQISLGREPYCVAVVRGNPPALRRITGAQLCLFPTTDYCALILPRENRDSLTRQMRELAPDCVWSLSGASGRVSELSRCFREALSLLEPHEIGREHGMVYPLSDQLGLVGALSGGDAAECEGILRELWRINEARDLPESERLQLLHRLATTAYHAYAAGEKTSDRAPIGCMDQVLACEKADERAFELLLELYRAVARACGATQRERSRSLIEAVREYIELNYADSSLSLDSVAEACHVSYFYLSHMFRAAGSESFSEMLNACRARKAGELIRQGELSLNEIALRVGYTSPGSFSRAFRKQTGVSPQKFK